MILHVVHAEKFIPAFIDFVEQHFGSDNHLYFVMGNTQKFPVKPQANVIVIKRTVIHKLWAMIRLSILMHRSRKIILHGLFRGRIILLLFIQSRLLAKCYWIIWGKDLYTYKLGKRTPGWRIKEIFRRHVIKNMGYLISYVKGDIELARAWYGARGAHLECIAYPSNLYKEYNISNIAHPSVNIQVGNSSDASNNHLEVFERLFPYKDQNIKIYVPLSYGDAKNREKVIKVGIEMFGDNFVPMTDFMPFDQYLDFLSRIDIALFNHKRQQGMGNAITLLGMGKTLYMREEVTSWNVFKDLGIKVLDIRNVTIDKLDQKIALSNQIKVKNYFSAENLVSQLRSIFD